MNIIKLNAISSTNDYLKDLTHNQYVENFTVVTAEHQTAGRGQMGAQWETEAGKNLTFSILIKDVVPEISSVFSLNIAIALSIVAALKRLNIPDLSIKWPNDILTGNKKLGGILIENSIKTGGEIHSIVGIGLNVNQIDFSGLPKATSLAVATNREFDKEAIIYAIIEELKPNVAKVMHNNTKILWDLYHQTLFKRNIPMPFEKNGKQFMGIIQGVTQNGNLLIIDENDMVTEYGIKEVAMLY